MSYKLLLLDAESVVFRNQNVLCRLQVGSFVLSLIYCVSRKYSDIAYTILIYHISFLKLQEIFFFQICTKPEFQGKQVARGVII